MVLNAKSIYLAPLLKRDPYLKPLGIASDFKSSQVWLTQLMARCSIHVNIAAFQMFQQFRV
ncbi:hypothetical protein JI59_25655 (plasmid) [Novosphingobium pentaromativorans US6-1]|nr:hypothetical protein JI59_25655 [Novosphingobium pentaromativorans US6-1]